MDKAEAVERLVPQCYSQHRKRWPSEMLMGL
jgi:hypothetical protein